MANGLLQVDNVDTIASAEDIRLHLGVPALGLMTEVHAGFKQLFHGDLCHFSYSFILVDFLRPDPFCQASSFKREPSCTDHEACVIYNWLSITLKHEASK